jgi:quinoprotein glucose dehydrogenase
VLRASTGELVWTFQTVHHDLWDYDVPMQPILFTLEREGRAVPAVAVGTKSGHIFVLNRETGVPLFPVEEHPVPQTTVPGEETSPTQPFPIALPVFGLRQLTPEDAWGLTPADIRTAREAIASVHWEGLFTPIGLKPTGNVPSVLGGFDWGGLSYDPERRILVRAVNRFATIVQLYPREQEKEILPTLEIGSVRLNRSFGLALLRPPVSSWT